MLNLTLNPKEIEWSHLHDIGGSTQHDDDAWIFNVHRFDESQNPGFGRSRSPHSRSYPSTLLFARKAEIYPQKIFL